MEEFIKNFYDVFDEIDISELTPQTRFRGIKEWSSLHGLATMNMLEQFYGKKISVEEFRVAQTIQDLYDMVK
jgi:acyl carrier protein